MARLIDRDKTLDKLLGITRGEPEYHQFILSEALHLVAIEPTVDAVPVVHGRWNPKPYYKADGKGGVFKYCDFYLCSECATERPIVPPYNYCPNCGAQMDK